MNDQIPNIEKFNVKPCRKCGAQERNKAGACKPCQKQAVLNYQAKNPEKVRATAKKYYDKNKEKRIANALNWNRANPNKAAKNNDKWRKSNPEYFLANREHRAELSREWRHANQEKVRAAGHNRRTKIRSSGKLSTDIVQTLMKLQKGKCACCGASLKNGYHLDHIMPIALGGSNNDDNVQLLTPLCNLRKGAKHPVEYMKEKGFLL